MLVCPFGIFSKILFLARSPMLPAFFLCAFSRFWQSKLFVVAMDHAHIHIVNVCANLFSIFFRLSPLFVNEQKNWNRKKKKKTRTENMNNFFKRISWEFCENFTWAVWVGVQVCVCVLGMVGGGGCFAVWRVPDHRTGQGCQLCSTATTGNNVRHN